MTAPVRFADLVQAALDQNFDRRAEQLASLGREVQPMLTLARELTAGGKRFRALFCYWGWRAATDVRDGFDPFGSQKPDPRLVDAVVRVCAALELFQAAALAHDDIIDASDERRGAPSAHRKFEARHRDGGWFGDGARFGTSAAILLGDWLTGLSADAFDEAIETFDPAAARAARREYGLMRSEVTLGQYLDLAEEHSWVTAPDSEALDRAMRIVVSKSARYSVEAPLAIGALLGGADDELVAALRNFGLPLGIAFQLRDDLLGVFGDPAATGKPAADDLREGKRTALVAIARERLPANMRSVVDELLGDGDLDDYQIDMLRTTFVECGAVAEIERRIAEHASAARTALEAAPIGDAVRRQLSGLIDAVTNRVR